MRGKPRAASWLGPQFPARQVGSIQSPAQEKEVGKRQQMNEIGFVDGDLPTLRDSCQVTLVITSDN